MEHKGRGRPQSFAVTYRIMKDLPDSLGLYVNKTSAEKMGVTIPPDVLAKAAHVF